MLLDTSGLLCCFDADDARHVQAVDFYTAATLRLTHNYVSAEFVALAQARRLRRDESLAFAGDVLADPEIEVIWVDMDIHESAMQVLRAQPDKAYSLCDAVSFVLMQKRHITDALTTDRHFEQAGFARLLPP